jgi:hypothetical protein
MPMSADPIEAGSADGAPWLRRHRLRLALGIAVVEGVIVALSADVSRWTVIAITVLALVLYLGVGKSTRWETGHQVLWIFAFSQALAVILTIFSFVLTWLALVLAAVLAVVVVVHLATDR